MATEKVGPTIVKLADAVELARQSQPKVFGAMETKRAERIVRSVWQQVLDQIGNTPEGVIRVPGVGAFVVKNVARKDGSLSRRMAFRPAASKPAAEKT